MQTSLTGGPMQDRILAITPAHIERDWGKAVEKAEKARSLGFVLVVPYDFYHVYYHKMRQKARRRDHGPG